MWKYVFGSVMGTAHERTGQPCQDCCQAVVIETPTGSVLVVACADGAGSASHSDLGARIACESILEQARESLEIITDDPRADLDEQFILAWYQKARRLISSEAEKIAVPPRQLACTLMTAIVGDRWAIFSQVGDGAIVRGSSPDCQVIFWPQTGEYANVTSFISDPSFPRVFQYTRLDEPVYELAILTDGLQPIALDYAKRQAFVPFFQPLFGIVRESTDAESLYPALREFLGSQRVNDRTDDDKTLFLATRSQ